MGFVKMRTYLVIGQVIQKTVIDVNEKGVEAAAVAAVGVSLRIVPIEVDPRSPQSCLTTASLEVAKCDRAIMKH